MKRPTEKQLERWLFEGHAYATDGCSVELDGTCPHGCESWVTIIERETWENMKRLRKGKTS